MVEGRWIKADDQKEMAISEGIYDYYPSIKSGDTIPVKFQGKEERWEVVGIFKFIGLEGTIAYAPYEYISREQNLANRSFSYRIVTDQHDRAYQGIMAKELDAYFRDQGFQVQEATPGLSTLDKASESLDILITFLLIMALLTATVGSMGLTGTMSMNVLERTREIGIMRAIGATDLEIVRMVIIEGSIDRPDLFWIGDDPGRAFYLFALCYCQQRGFCHPDCGDFHTAGIFDLAGIGDRAFLPGQCTASPQRGAADHS